MADNIPSELKLLSRQRVVKITFDDEAFHLPCEYLRVFSPSAEVMGHGPGQEVLQTDKEDVNIVAIEPVGQYAVRLIFSDSHNSGLYGWDYLHHLCIDRQQNWQSYQQRLQEAGHQREPQANDHFLQ